MGRVKHNHLVAVVGRPNVGKSTLINRIFGERIAIVDDMPGVTRDRMYLQCEWSGHEFMMIDTGGLIFEDEDDINNSVQEQAWMAVDEADVILFVVDGKYGLHPTDKFIANALRQNHGKPVILAVNKVDDRGEDYTKTADFYELGLGEPHAISAIHSNNVGDLLSTLR